MRARCGGSNALVAVGLAVGLAFVHAPTLALESSDEPARVGTERKRSDETGLKLAVEPADVKVFIDGRERGTAGELSFIALDPGTHTLRLVRGGDEFEAEIPLKRGQIVEFRYDFE
jgi:hypothetical protein